ncbi:ABC transporter permease [Christensenellaceae bacterium OttesenSCG-928-K19]|nr:ABC transporter permease [Christensenellaceae bacterium OttesenSCG-928-K19]
MNQQAKTERIKNIFSSNQMIVIYIIAGMLILIAGINPSAFGPATFIDTGRSMLTMLMFALCEMIVIISGGIDVSFPAFATFCMYATTKLMVTAGIDGVLLSFVIAGAMGLGLGLLNGFLVGTCKIPTLIATLGTSSLIHGALLSFVGVNDITNLPPQMDEVGKQYLFQVQTDAGVSSMSIFIILPIVLCVIVWLLLRYTMLGRSIYAIGGDVNSAQRAGFNVKRTQYFIYMFVGVIVGIGGMTYTLLARNANTTQLMGSEMMVIAAVVIGGARITGGHGNVLGTILGVALINIVSNNLIVMGVPTYWQTFLIGLLIIVGVIITSVKAKRVALAPKI